MWKRRNFFWIIAIIVGYLFFKGGQFIEYRRTLPAESEKQAITVCAPEDMEEAFKSALRVAGLHETHKIVMTEEDNANICVEYAKQNDENYQKIAFSPFVVAYGTSDSCTEKLKEAEVFVPSPYDKELFEIDLYKIIVEAMGNGKWAKFGIQDENELKVFYPSQDTIYWQDFHDFLLLTVNNGKYPGTEKELQNAEKTIAKFVNSEHTEGIIDFNEQVRRTGGFPSSAIYIMTEKDALDICSSQQEKTSIYYPINVVYFNYYIKGDNIGKQIIAVLDEEKDDNIITREEIFLSSNFYYDLGLKRYRSAQYPELKSSTDYAYYERDMYNVAKFTKTEELVTMPITQSEETTVQTEATTPTRE